MLFHLRSFTALIIWGFRDVAVTVAGDPILRIVYALFAIGCALELLDQPAWSFVVWMVMAILAGISSARGLFGQLNQHSQR